MTTDTERLVAPPSEGQQAPELEGSAPAETLDSLKSQLATMEKELQKARTEAGNIRTRKQQDAAIAAIETQIRRMASRVDLLTENADNGEEFREKVARLSAEEREEREKTGFQNRMNRYIERVNARMQKVGISDLAVDTRFDQARRMFGEATSADDLDDAYSFVDDVIDEIVEKRRDDEKKSQEEAVKKARNEGVEEGRQRRERQDATDMTMPREGGGGAGRESLDALLRKDTRGMGQKALAKLQSDIDAAMREQASRAR